LLLGHEQGGGPAGEFMHFGSIAGLQQDIRGVRSTNCGGRYCNDAAVDTYSNPANRWVAEAPSIEIHQVLAGMQAFGRNQI
jgi:hypothetical protein